MSEIGREIRRLREEKDWSQAQLAVYAGSSQPTVNQVESGKRNPSTRTLEKFADALGVEVADLFPKAQAPLQLELEAQRGDDEERYGSNAVWRAEYLARGNEMLDKWEHELEEKLALAESEPVRFFDWLEGVRQFGRPLMMGVVSGYIAACGPGLEAVARSAEFLGPWDNLWLRIEERVNQMKTFSKEDEKRFREEYEKARTVR
jgi:transcriptional regulator with XRE-family HTH domain